MTTASKIYPIGLPVIQNEQIVPAEKINMKAPFAAGAIFSTTEDIFKWQSAFDSERLLKQETINITFTPEKRNYGY